MTATDRLEDTKHNDMGKYDSILYKERPLDTKHPAMSLNNRAAQFAPFDALNGFDGQIFETARIVSPKLTLSEDVKQVINERLYMIEQSVSEAPVVTVTYFVPDVSKDGGSYRTVTAAVKKLLPYEKQLILENDLIILFDDISQLDGDMFAVKYD